MKLLLIVLFFTSCQSMAKTNLEECLDDIQDNFYADTCGEEDTDGPDAHHDGYQCALQLVRYHCLEIQK